MRCKYNAFTTLTPPNLGAHGPRYNAFAAGEYNVVLGDGGSDGAEVARGASRRYSHFEMQA